jgi:hypothetical protein
LHPPTRWLVSVLDPALSAHLLALHAALDLDSLWTAIVNTLDAALPVNDLIAALPCEGLTPMTFHTTVEVEDKQAYRLRIEKAEPPRARLITETQAFSRPSSTTK